MRVGHGRAPHPLTIAFMLVLGACDGTDVLTPKPELFPAFIQIAGDRHWTDWSEYASGLQPVGFSQVWDPSSHFKIVDDSVAPNKMLEWSSPAVISRNRFGLAYDGAGTMTDQSVYTEVRIRALSGSATVWYLGAAAVRMGGSAAAESGYAAWFVANGTQRSVALASFTSSGSYRQFANFDLNWAIDTWYSVRMEAIGTTIRVRLWPRGAPEPQIWQMQTTDSAYPVGKPGVANHDNAVVQWDAWEVSGAAAPEPPPTLIRIALTPEAITLTADSSATFAVQGVLSNGNNTNVPVAYTTTGGTITSAGVYTANATPGTYQVIATYQGTPAVADTSVVTITSPQSGVALVNHFTTDAVGTPPAGWTETANPNSSDWTVAADAGVSDGRVLRNVTTATARHILRLNAVGDTTTTQEIVVRMRLGDADGRGPGVALRHTMNGSAENAYVAYLRPNNGTIEVNRFMNGAFAFIGQANFINQPGQWYWIRFRAEGNTLRVKVWNDASQEPAAWMFQGNDTGLTAGSAGLYTYEPNTVDYDGVGFAAGGATAPPPTNGSPPQKMLVNIVATPAATSIIVGGSAQFSVYGRWNDGDSTAVSVTWQATGGSINAAGLFTAGNTPGTYQVIATHTTAPLADTSIVSITAVPFAASSFTTGFSTDSLGRLPGGWTATAYPANSTWRVEADTTASDGHVLRNVATATGRHILRFDGVPDTTTTQEVLVRMRLGDADNRGPGIALRHRMNGTRETAYVAYLRPGTNVVEINRFLDGGWLFVGSASFVNTAGTWYWMRFRAEGTTLSVKVWANGTAEPAAWTHVANDAGIASGSLGLYTYEPNTVDYDQFGYAVRGATALRPMLLNVSIR